MIIDSLGLKNDLRKINEKIDQGEEADKIKKMLRLALEKHLKGIDGGQLHHDRIETHQAIVSE